MEVEEQCGRLGMKCIKLSKREKGTKVDRGVWSTLDKVFTNLRAKESTTLKNYSTSDHVPVYTEVYCEINKFFKRAPITRLSSDYNHEKVVKLMTDSTWPKISFL